VESPFSETYQELAYTQVKTELLLGNEISRGRRHRDEIVG